MGRSSKYPNETTDERKARQRFATKQRVQKSRQRQKEMKALASIQLQQEESTFHHTLALLEAASKASELACLAPKRNVGRLWAPYEAEALRKGVDKYGTGKWQMILRDEEYGPVLKDRSNVDLKDKWRCLMGRTHLTVAASSALVELAQQPSSHVPGDWTYSGLMEEEDEDEAEEDGQHSPPRFETRAHAHRTPSQSGKSFGSNPVAPPSPVPAAKRAPVSPDLSDDESMRMSEPMQVLHASIHIVANARKRAANEITRIEESLRRARESLAFISYQEDDLIQEFNRLHKRRRQTDDDQDAMLGSEAERSGGTNASGLMADTANSKEEPCAERTKQTQLEGSTPEPEATTYTESLVLQAMLEMEGSMDEKKSQDDVEGKGQFPMAEEEHNMCLEGLSQLAEGVEQLGHESAAMLPVPTHRSTENSSA
mmetsp:Transcript_26308/g.49967  ORF Transcript_26308/g.49967 Transcript_26308/m.49967 type:complete len:427 (+) Transcript_26308:476-1756(+)|eukprot:CAMPEP_0114249120 /NCGR_PEP_ID=MMETSP0058-20121206/13960_1 /TAXON_ID=36894 /ORGANISM="Pyramimonas parkeae, CCMP726" /LENGTH=426 /DNA_ID=CAMNT_0001362619 /DNA_START=460 /DNA_END=1740 /DNA_ORIENTATION=+